MLTVDINYLDAKFDESKHRRNHGEFATTSGGGSVKQPKSIQELSSAELQKAYTRSGERQSKITDELIAAGRGQEKAQETLKKSDPLSVRYAEESKRYRDIYDEMQARRKYHGGLHPIRRK